MQELKIQKKYLNTHFFSCFIYSRYIERENISCKTGKLRNSNYVSIVLYILYCVTHIIFFCNCTWSEVNITLLKNQGALSLPIDRLPYSSSLLELVVRAEQRGLLVVVGGLADGSDALRRRPRRHRRALLALRTATAHHYTQNSCLSQ